ncbi:lipid transferase CIDEA [Aplochiton taeniatus]
MTPISITSGVEYAKTFLPDTLLRSVSTVQTSFSRRLLPLPAPPQPRPYKVCTPSRSKRRGLVAASLEDLLHQTVSVFLLSCRVLTLVLEDDGTVVDSEAFFQSLPPNTALMVLQEGEGWVHSQTKTGGIAKVTFDLYKLNPKDFLGCLTIRATLYEIYTLSCDIRCTKAKDILKFLLRSFTYLARLAGQLLLCGSSYILQRIGDD